MSAGGVTRWSQRFLATAALLLVAWQAATLAGLGRRVGVVLGVYGFVLHTVFGKAYALVPSYFDRQLAVPRAPAVQFPLSALGVVAMAAGIVARVPLLRAVGGLFWLAGAAVFVGAVGWTIRDNLTGAETGTWDADADRAGSDRVANAFVPVAVAYLLVGSYETAAVFGDGVVVALPSLLGGYPPQATHLVAAGTAALVLFAVGFRLLLRFLVATPPRGAVSVVLPAAALGPALIAVGLPAGPAFVAGAALEAVAVLGFAATYWTLFARTDRDRVGLWGPLAGVTAGAVAALLGLHFALVAVTPGLATAHYRLMTTGLLGLSIVGTVYHFYPPAVGTLPGAGDRTALASIALLAAGLAVEVVGLAAASALLATVGQSVGLLGAVTYASLLVGIFAGKRRR
jgi:hypothetical protein